MTRLLLETATDVCSVAVARGAEVLAEHTAGEKFQHSSHLTVFIKQVLREASVTIAELSEVVLSDGPGSYTSLRVGAATAKGLCVALPGLQLRVVPTLTALAVASDVELVLATINSRRGEVFGQLFYKGATSFGVGALNVSLVQSIVEDEQGWWAAPRNIRLTETDWAAPLLALERTVMVVGPGRERLLQATGLPKNLEAGFPEYCSATHLLAPATSPFPSYRVGPGGPQPGSTDGDLPAYSRLVDIASYEPFYLNPPFVTKSRKQPLG